MKTNKKIVSFFLVLILVSSILILTPVVHCYSASTAPVPIKKVVYIPPDPVIDDGEPGEDPNFNWEFGNNFLLSDSNVSKSSRTTSQDEIQIKRIRIEFILRYLVNVFFSLK